MKAWEEETTDQLERWKLRSRDLDNNVWSVAVIDSFSENLNLSRLYRKIRPKINNKTLQGSGKKTSS